MVDAKVVTLENEVGALWEEAKTFKILVNGPETIAPNKIKI